MLPQEGNCYHKKETVCAIKKIFTEEWEYPHKKQNVYTKRNHSHKQEGNCLNKKELSTQEGNKLSIQKGNC